MSEWALIGFFVYIAVVALLFPLDPAHRLDAAAVAAATAVACWGLARLETASGSQVFSMIRDWLPIAFTLVAYREMDWFATPHPTHALESSWVLWDRTVLHAAGLQGAIETLGFVLPGFLELCYLLVYGVAPATVGILYGYERRDLVDRVLFIYLVGTLLAYALFPYFPSDPPRTLFADSDLPNVMTPLRRLNLAIVGGYGIHSSVFPSAHVSSAFSAGWGLLVFLDRHRWVGGVMLAYGASVAVATIYGRYHYAVDAVAGFVASLAALLAAIVVTRNDRLWDRNGKLAL